MVSKKDYVGFKWETSKDARDCCASGRQPQCLAEKNPYPSVQNDSEPGIVSSLRVYCDPCSGLACSRGVQFDGTKEASMVPFNAFIRNEVRELLQYSL